jgi:ribosomal 50S subunit-recycling heat shock protein
MLEHKVVFLNDQAVKKAKEVKIGDVIEIRYLEKSEKFKILQIPTTKSTPKSKIEEYVQRID